MKDADDEGAVNTGSNLFVTGIHPRLTESDVSRLFDKYGEVESCSIMLDPHTKESRGFGFVKMVTADQADAAKEGLQGEVIEGRTLSIEKARRARPRTPTPGKYFGPPKRGKLRFPFLETFLTLPQVTLVLLVVVEVVASIDTMTVGVAMEADVTTIVVVPVTILTIVANTAADVTATMAMALATLIAMQALDVMIATEVVAIAATVAIVVIVVIVAMIDAAAAVVAIMTAAMIVVGMTRLLVGMILVNLTEVVETTAATIAMEDRSGPSLLQAKYGSLVSAPTFLPTSSMAVTQASYPFPIQLMCSQSLFAMLGRRCLTDSAGAMTR
jgi:RNA recognition motif. (a.k.a. RRM, RBD, or RNP domain)